MIKSFTGTEFAKALTEGTLKEPIVKIGMVKKEDGHSSALFFAEGSNCANWIEIPLELIEEVKYLTTIKCRDHEHPLVQITFKEPAEKQAQVFAQLARGSSRRRSHAGASDFTIDPLPSERCMYNCFRWERLCELFGGDCSGLYDQCASRC